jgi:hypothetical protein
VYFTQVRSGGYRKNIQLHSPDVVESPAEKAGRLNEDGIFGLFFISGFAGLLPVVALFWWCFGDTLLGVCGAA